MAAHSMAHVYEMEGRYDEGIKFMQKTVKNWEVICMFAKGGHYQVIDSEMLQRLKLFPSS